jgi:ABC-type branched-subunit amino acid transport system permease subunit
VSFGHAAFVGLGAYATGILISEGVVGSGWHLLATVAVTGLAALAIGAISLRTRGVYFIMITLAFAQMLFYLANSVKGYGGDEGLNIKARSVLGFGAFRDRPEESARPLVCRGRRARRLAARARALRPVAPRPRGAGLRDDDVRAEALGFPTYRLKLVVFVVAGVLGGVAGALSVNLQGYVSPNVLHWTQSGTLMVMVILGGVATVWGGLVGAAALLLLQEVLAAYTEHWEFWTGWVLLAVVLFARQGLVGLLGSARRSRGAAPMNSRVGADGPTTRALAARAMRDERARRVALRCSTSAASRSASAAARDRSRRSADPARRGACADRAERRRQDHLIAQLGGQLASDRGRIAFDGHDITRLSPHQRARRGLVRSFQVTRLFGSASVLDNVALAVQAVSGHSFAAWRPVRREAALFARAAAVLDDIGLAAKAQSSIAALSHGERRALEVGLALASRRAWCCSTSRWPASGRTNRRGWNA